MKAKTQVKTTRIKNGHFIQSNPKRPFFGANCSSLEKTKNIKSKVKDFDNLEKLVQIFSETMKKTSLTINDLSLLCAFQSKWVCILREEIKSSQELCDVMYEMATFTMIHFNNLKQDSLDKLKNKDVVEFTQMIYDLGLLGAACLVDEPIISTKKINEIGLFLLLNRNLTSISIINFIAGWGLLAKYKVLDLVHLETDIFNQLLKLLNASQTLSDKDIAKTLYSLVLIKESNVLGNFNLKEKLVLALQNKLKMEDPLELEKFLHIRAISMNNFILPSPSQPAKEEPILEKIRNYPFMSGSH